MTANPPQAYCAKKCNRYRVIFAAIICTLVPENIWGSFWK